MAVYFAKDALRDDAFMQSNEGLEHNLKYATVRAGGRRSAIDHTVVLVPHLRIYAIADVLIQAQMFP